LFLIRSFSFSSLLLIKVVILNHKINNFLIKILNNNGTFFWKWKYMWCVYEWSKIKDEMLVELEEMVNLQIKGSTNLEIN
jgi:hypothetical protein